MLLSELIGRSVLCTDTGETVGRISRLLLGSRGRRIAYYALQDDWYLPPRVIAGEHLRIHSIAVVPSQSHVHSIIDVPEAVELANRTVVLGAPVYTRGGDFAGRVEDWSFTESGALEFLRIAGQDIPLDDICVVGRDAVIIAAGALLPDYERPLDIDADADEPENVAPEESINITDPPSLYAAALEGDPAPATAIDDLAAKARAPIPVPPPASLQAPFSEVGERAAAFLCGQCATQDIALPDGQVLIRRGEAITPEVITAAKAFDKLVELTIKAAPASQDIEGGAEIEEVE